MRGGAGGPTEAYAAYAAGRAEGANEAACFSRPLRFVGAFVLGAQPLELFGVEPHAEGEAHLAQDRLDLVERLLAEVLGLEQLGLAFLHEVGDRPDVRGLEAVRRARSEERRVGKEWR